jgi:HTH-type transcriptional regulator/antitoxin HigA
MITNERQYIVASAQAEKFREALARLKDAPSQARVHTRIRQAEIDGLQSQVADLRRELDAYKKLKTGNVSVLRHTGLASIAHALIKARIAEGLKQEDLAALLGVKAQQVQRYEATEYQTASLARLHRVADVLGLKWEHIVTRTKKSKVRARRVEASEVK